MVRRVCLLLALAGVPGGAEADPGLPKRELERVQAQIESFNHLRAGEFALPTPPFRFLSVSYIQAFGPLVGEGQPFSITGPEGWAGPDGARERFVRRIEQDMRRWHPIFSLTFLETVLKQPEWGLYALMLRLEGQDAADAVQRYRSRRAEAYRLAGLPEAQADRRVEEETFQEATRQWEVFAAIVEENLVRILARSLHVDPVSYRLDVIERVTVILEWIALRGRYRQFDERVRSGKESPTLPQTVHEVAGKLLADSNVDPELKQRRFTQLLDLFVMLQNEESRDQLLLLFAQFDGHARGLGERRQPFETALNETLVLFILASLQEDPAGELGLDVVDQLTRWIVTRLELGPRGLQQQRIVDTLLLLRDNSPPTLERYLVRFYRDFHRLEPAGYETVIFHLVSLVLQYAEQGVYVLPDPVDEAEKPALAQDLPQEKVMRLLGWYNAALVEVGPSLPDIDLDYIAREQRAVLDRILDFFQLALTLFGPDSQPMDPRFIETLLQLVQRIAHVAPPRILARRVLRPYAAMVQQGLEPSPAMERYIEEIATIVAGGRP